MSMGHANLGIVDGIFPILLQDDVTNVDRIMMDTFPVLIKALFESIGVKTLWTAKPLATPSFYFSSVIVSVIIIVISRIFIIKMQTKLILRIWKLSVVYYRRGRGSKLALCDLR